jgi:hypothetical protein
MPRPLIALLCMLLPMLALAADPVGRLIPYQNLYGPLAGVRQVDPQGIVISSLRAESAQKDQPLPADLKMELRFGTTRQPVALDRDGRFTLPLRADWATGDAALWINQPKSAVVVVEGFTMRTPTATRLNYGQLMESLPVMERVVKQQAGMMSLVAPKPQGVELAFAPDTPQSVIVGVGVQAKTWRTDAKGHVQVPFDPALPATTPVVLSALPVALQPYAN